MSIRALTNKTVVLATVAALALSGCTTQSQRIGADDGSDVCRPQRVTLDSTGDYFGEDIVKGAAVGAVSGALLGALIGGDLKSAAIGAAAGGAVGAAGGYWQARQQQAKDQASLMQSVSSDLAQENERIDKTQLAFDQLITCRKNEAARIRSDLAAGRITRPQAEALMAGVKQRSQKDLEIARTISGKIQERSQNYAFANDQINPPPAAPAARPATGTTATAPRPATAPAPRPLPADPQKAQVQTATSTNLAKRDKFEQSIQSASANQSAFELS